MKNVFSYNADVDKTAYMNWRTNHHQPIHNMNTIADGYFESAIILAQQCVNDNRDKKADILIFPMFFSVNHAIELYGKSICWSLNILLGYKSTYKENHDIRGIWLTAKEKIKKFGFDDTRPENEFNKMVINLELYLDELSKTIGETKDVNTAYYNIDFSRYPLNNRSKNHFYLNKFDNVAIDLENFVEIFSDIHDCLERLATYYYNLVVESWQDN